MWRRALGLGLIFAAATGMLYASGAAMARRMKGPGPAFPKDLHDLRLLAQQLQQLKEDNFYSLLLFFSAAYLYKQAFAIPGSSLMNVLCGALFGVKVGLPLVCVLTAVGASLCYLLSKAFARQWLLRWYGLRLQSLQEKLNSDRKSLLLVLISLRLFPFSPNWFLNMASPIAGVPLTLFFPSVLIGLVPYNYLCVQSGLVLSQLQDLSQVLSPANVATLALGTVGTLLLTLIVKRYKGRV